MRVGFGYDVHRLVEGRRLVLGGVEIEYPLGLLGVSDGDVVLHSISDAILGAIGRGDIGIYFPPNSVSSQGLDSKVILGYVVDLAKKEGFEVNNIDVTIVVERPKLNRYYDVMKQVIAGIVGIGETSVNVKAKSNEGMDSIGRGEAIAAYSVVSVQEVKW